ncbi:helix-turn-helix domain-containing protein [Actinophytocola glycyrrhizae]|uniref:Helix-turn-helix domain-containing protein n=1 Tax=Actinophytocola glycyrrhizae TaxID=2044873 RepID=A0ABV9S9M5_9PSEU
MDLRTDLAQTAARPDTVEHDDPATRYHRLVGAELRQLRKRLNWTRRDLRRRLRNDISLQALATYELGTRQCTVSRFVEVCFALGAAPHEVLARVHATLLAEDADATRTEGVRVDLRIVAENDDLVLAPLRRWAAARRSAGADDAATAFLDQSALASLAQLCAIPADDLANRLNRLCTGQAPAAG